MNGDVNSRIVHMKYYWHDKSYVRYMTIDVHLPENIVVERLTQWPVTGEFNIFTREAGAGGLSIAVEGPSKAEIDFQDRKDGSCGVSYLCTEPGEYMVSVKFNDQHIPDSPFKVYVSPATGDMQKLSITSMQQQGLQVGIVFSQMYCGIYKRVKFYKPA